MFSDSDPLTWEKCSISTTLPSETDYLAIWVNITGNIFNDYSAPEFDGHFADQVSLTIVPELATILLLTFGGLALIKKR